jgi:hypothetical protein
MNLQYIQKGFVSKKYIVLVTQFQAIKATNFRALTDCINVSYVAGHERASGFFVSVYRAYTVSIDNSLIYICEA